MVDIDEELVAICRENPPSLMRGVRLRMVPISLYSIVPSTNPVGVVAVPVPVEV